MGRLDLIAAQRERAVQVLPAAVAAYVAAGSWDQVSAGEATAAWDRFRLRPRVLRDVSAVATSTSLLGTDLAVPLLASPTAYHGLLDPAGEVATAAGVGAAGAGMVLSTRCSARLEDVAAAAGPWWFQVYVMRQRSVTAGMVQRAAAAGARGLVLTVDAPLVPLKPGAPIPVPPSGRHANTLQHLDPRVAGDEAAALAAVTQDPSVGAEAVAWLRELSGLPVAVKGVLRGDDAAACVDAGAAAVVVSNHGGRQLDRAVATADALEEVVGAVGGRVPVLVDGGLHDGIAVLTALALGADAVLIGRPVAWALAAGGAEGVRDLFEALAADLRAAMALAGVPSLADADGSLVARPAGR